MVAIPIKKIPIENILIFDMFLYMKYIKLVEIIPIPHAELIYPYISDEPLKISAIYTASKAEKIAPHVENNIHIIIIIFKLKSLYISVLKPLNV